MKLKVILASVRPERLGERVAIWVCNVLEEAGIEFELLDLKNYPMPFDDTNIEPFDLQKKYPHKIVQDWSEKIDEGECYLVITPEYNHGYPAQLKNAIDWLGEEWWGKPIGFVSYSTGRMGGSRAVAQLRQVVINFNMYDTRGEINLPQADKLIAADGKCDEPALNQAVVKTANELLALAKKLKS
jgi:NAD(P)H-dependent FMN reductase